MGKLSLGEYLKYLERYSRQQTLTHYVDADHIQSMCHNDDGLSMMAMSASRSPVTHAQFLPSREVAEWHMMRSRVRARAVDAPGCRGNPNAIHRGAISWDPVTRTSVSLWWVHDFVKQRLYLGKLTVRRRQGLEFAIRMVFGAAVCEAVHWRLKEIIAWDPMPRLVAQAENLAREVGCDMTATLENRSEMVPCFRWHGDEAKEVVWTEAEYYGWG
ncbi:hypothetical protein Trco_007595 [Trichoderma cornu-damae]|uniref:LYC1 C-terminal domain-containing protein n=1 Tax=Trichoderma cornu-damae TaxID=654480 RepID=A0A9P8TUH0_9HYPO|nr:hypothetical protein Trco_007595 [Trichoderma cornu-damae]